MSEKKKYLSKEGLRRFKENIDNTLAKGTHFKSLYPFDIEVSSVLNGKNEDPSVFIDITRWPVAPSSVPDNLWIFLMRTFKNRRSHILQTGWRHPYYIQFGSMHYDFTEWEVFPDEAGGYKTLHIDNITQVAGQFVGLVKSKAYGNRWMFNRAYEIKRRNGKRMSGLGFAAFVYDWDNDKYVRVSKIVPVKIAMRARNMNDGVSADNYIVTSIVAD